MRHRRTLFSVVSADPPWQFGDDLPGKGRGAEKHYPTMSVEEICAFPLPPIAPNAVLFLWRVSAMPSEALEVARAWGFEVKSEVVWVKKTRGWKTVFGMGRSVRLCHEVALIATRGRPRRLSGSVRSVFEAPLGRHSAKPEAFYSEVVEKLYAGPYAELFARRERAGWTSFGNELKGGRSHGRDEGSAPEGDAGTLVG